MKNKRKNLIITLLPIVIIPLIYAAAIVYKAYIKIYIPPCPIRTFLGIYCPGCGMTHSFYALLSGDILSSVKYNAGAAAGVILLILYWLKNLLSLFNININPRSSIFIYTASGIAAVYYILRNFIPFIAP